MNDATILFIPIPTFFSSSRINWWKLWLSMDCLSIWQAGHYLANGNIVIIPKWAIMLDQLYEAATSVSWKAKFCVNLYRGWTPSSFFDHQISSLEWCSVMAFKNASARFGSYEEDKNAAAAESFSLPPPPPSQFLGWDLLSWDLSSLLDPLNLTWARISLILHEKSKSSLPLLLQSWITWSKSRTDIRNQDFWNNPCTLRLLMCV